MKWYKKRKCAICGREYVGYGTSKYCSEQCKRLAFIMKHQKITVYPWFLDMETWQWKIKGKHKEKE